MKESIVYNNNGMTITYELTNEEIALLEEYEKDWKDGKAHYLSSSDVHFGELQHLKPVVMSLLMHGFMEERKRTYGRVYVTTLKAKNFIYKTGRGQEAKRLERLENKTT